MWQPYIVFVTVMVFFVGAFAQNDENILPSFNQNSSGNKDLAVDENIEVPLVNSAPNNFFNGVPPGFERVLPDDVVKQLRELHTNNRLSFSEKREKFDEIMDSVPGETLTKLPLPPGFEMLPENVQENITSIHNNASLTWIEKHKLVTELVDSLPQNDKILGRNLRRINFPPTPPPGFEKVLPKEIYEQLLKIHRDPKMEPKQKIKHIDEIMRSLPQGVLERLPLPPRFELLRPDLLTKVRRIFSDRTLDYETKNKAIIIFVKSLPEDQRALIRPPLPPALNQLPQKVKDDIEAVFLNEKIDEEQRDGQFWNIIDRLPRNQRQKIYDEMNELENPLAKAQQASTIVPQ